jgi:hypothetical protein
MTSNDFFSLFDFNLRPTRTLNPKCNRKQTLPKNPTLLLVNEKPPQKATEKNQKIKVGSATIDDFSQLTARSRRLTSSRL